MRRANNRMHRLTTHDRCWMEHRPTAQSPGRSAPPMKRSAGAPPQVVVRSIAFTQDALEALERLTTTIGARGGRKSSASAVVRALLRHAQDVPEIAEKLA